MSNNPPRTTTAASKAMAASNTALNSDNLGMSGTLSNNLMPWLQREVTTDESLFERASRGQLEVLEFHDELVGHGRVATHSFRAHAHAVATFEHEFRTICRIYSPPTSNNGNNQSGPPTSPTAASLSASLSGSTSNGGGSTQNPATPDWLAPLRLELLTFIKKIMDTNGSSKPRRIVDKVTSPSCMRAVREKRERDAVVGTAFDKLWFFCGSVVYEIELEIKVYTPLVWRFENDYSQMHPFGKVDAARLERIYQQMGGKGVTEPIKGAYGRTYVFDFTEMTQMNEKTKKKRKISRAPDPANTAANAAAAMVIPCGESGRAGSPPPPNNSALAAAAANNSNTIASPTTTAGNRATSTMMMMNRPQSPQSTTTVVDPSYFNNEGISAIEQRTAAAILAQKNDARRLLLDSDAEADRKKRELLEEEERQRQAHARAIEIHKRQHHGRSRPVSALSVAVGSPSTSASASPTSALFQQQQQQQQPAIVIEQPHKPASASSSSSSLPSWLAELQLPPHNVPLDVLQLLQAQRIDEDTFLLLRTDDLAALGVLLGPRLALLRAVEQKKQKRALSGGGASGAHFTNTGATQLSANNSSGTQGGGMLLAGASATSNNNTAASMMTMNQSFSDNAEVLELMQQISQKFPRALVIDPSDVELVAPISSGGFGTVYEAFIANRPVAAKMFDSVSDGIAECELLASMHHKNIVNLVGVSAYVPRTRQQQQQQSQNPNNGSFSGSGGLFSPVSPAAANNNSVSSSTSNLLRLRTTPRVLMLMEIAEGSLSNVLQHAAMDLEWDVVLRFSLQIAQGLEYIHRTDPSHNKRMIVHRDVKPGNLLLFGDGQLLKLCDFGISRATDHTATNATRAGVGSNFYCPPEQILSTAITPAVDVFAAGVIMVFMITGVNPGEYLPQDRRECAAAGPKLLEQELLRRKRPGCPPWLIEVCRACIQGDPQKRPKDGASLLRLFHDHADGFKMLVRGVECQHQHPGSQFETVTGGATQEMTGVTLSMTF